MALEYLGLLVVLPLACATADPQHPEFLQHHGNEAKQGITPELEPVSDSKFFKKDYPDDTRPGPYNHFGYPYPEVQDSDHYDKDYVEDRNDDNGYWKAQMDYDAIRNKLTKEKEQLKKALAKEAQEKKDVEKAEEAEKKAEAEAVAAEKAENKAEADHAKAEADLEGLKNDIDQSADLTDEEVTDLEECKKQLIKTKAKLKEELADKAKREAEQKAHEGAERDSEKEEVAAMKTEAELEEALRKEQAEYDAALAAYNAEKNRQGAAEAEVIAAAKALKELRHADPDGGVYEVAKGAAYQSTALTSLSLVLIIVQMF